MKKLIAIALCLFIVASLCVAVFATEGKTEETKVSSVTTPTVEPTEKPTEQESPSTGASDLGSNNWAIALAVVLGVGGAYLATKKLVKGN